MSEKDSPDAVVGVVRPVSGASGEPVSDPMREKLLIECKALERGLGASRSKVKELEHALDEEKSKVYESESRVAKLEYQLADSQGAVEKLKDSLRYARDSFIGDKDERKERAAAMSAAEARVRSLQDTLRSGAEGIRSVMGDLCSAMSYEEIFKEAADELADARRRIDYLKALTSKLCTENEALIDARSSIADLEVLTSKLRRENEALILRIENDDPAPQPSTTQAHNHYVRALKEELRVERVRARTWEMAHDAALARLCDA